MQCPFLGIKDDPNTLFDYPISSNFCHRCKPIAIPAFDHQRNYCLTVAYKTCPIFRGKLDGPFPPSLKYRRGQNKFHHWKKLFSILFPVILLTTIIVSLLILGKMKPGMPSPTMVNLTQPQIIVTSSPSTTAQLTDIVTNDVQAQETLTPFRTFDPNISSTQAPISLDVPFGNTYKFIIHRIARGETLALFAQEYGTTSEAIIKVNYQLPTTIWEGYLIIIPVNNEDVDGLPSFKAYTLSENSITLEKLAEKLHYDVDVLATYNGIDADYLLSSGDWLLLPHINNSPKVTP
jgi:LysM repeat protein